MPTSRTVIRWMSLLVAVIGWGAAITIWLIRGYEAGVDPAFILAASLGICFTIVWARAVSDNDNNKNRDGVFALGYRQGVVDGRAMQGPTPNSDGRTVRLVQNS